MEPKDVDAKIRLAGALQARGELQRAIAEYREIIQLKPDDPFVHRKLGELLGDIADFDNAIASYREALRLNPHDHQAHYCLGYLFLGLGRHKEAIPHLEAFIRNAPNSRAWQERARIVKEELWGL